ncbi:hypothetical protein Micbo1qcDRAFT_206575 [Microdochium bolleyi]|uniref:Uncharacterized protein n=1 Tax=Microdochium bolleyi TaxID=196109 RepID=A0A136IW32_9PEZI|nr:hypothetical protein Micbo1qcDRAFT_206575 [Microdochium bolleyi]
MKFATALYSAALLATAAVAVPAGMIATTDRAVVGRECTCAPIPGACFDSCGKYTCWSNCWSRAAAPEEGESPAA